MLRFVEISIRINEIEIFNFETNRSSAQRHSRILPAPDQMYAGVRACTIPHNGQRWKNVQAKRKEINEQETNRNENPVLSSILRPSTACMKSMKWTWKLWMYLIVLEKSSRQILIATLNVNERRGRWVFLFWRMQLQLVIMQNTYHLHSLRPSSPLKYGPMLKQEQSKHFIAQHKERETNKMSLAYIALNLLRETSSTDSLQIFLFCELLAAYYFCGTSPWVMPVAKKGRFPAVSVADEH